MGINQESSKSSYYKFMRKELKKSYDNIISNDFNKNYSLQMSKFNSEKKKKKYISDDEGDIIDWKIFLLNQFSTSDKKSWKYSIFNFIKNEHDYKVQNYEIYFLENEIFMNQFSLLINPKLYMKNRIDEENPILYLFSKEELEEYTEIKDKFEDYNINKNNEEEEINEKEIMLEIDDVEDAKGKLKRHKSKILNITKSMEGLYSFESLKTFNEKNINEINTYKIREHITLIRSQLNKENHPILKIIKKFSENYTQIIKIRYESIKKINDIGKINDVKNKIIKDIQTFVEIISVGLKLFYSKTINYEIFVSERDEFINLICYFLFKDDNFYINLFSFFELSNKEKYNTFKLKKIDLGQLEPQDFGVSPKFCLNKITKEIKDKELYNENSNTYKVKTGIVDYFEKLDLNQEKYNISFYNNMYSAEGIKDISTINKKNIFKSFYDTKTENRKSKFKKGKIIKEEIKEETDSIKHCSTISSYKEFSQQLKSLNESIIEKYEEEMNNNPSGLNIPKINNENNENNIPYYEEMKYIQTIKDYNFPLDKLTIIALTSVIITKSVDNFWKGINIKNPKKFLNIDADELLSIYLYIIYNINLPSIYTELDFINYFTGSITKQSMIGYYYTTIEGCLNFIMSSKCKEDFIKINK